MADAGPTTTTTTPSSSVERSNSGHALHTEHGVTSIASSVVAKIAGLATQEIPGVQAMGKSMTRTIGALRAKVPGGSAATTQGVSVEVGERQAAVDIDIVAYYGQSIVETANAIRHNVIERIEAMTGLDVVEVNVSVDDLYIESDGTDDSQGSRGRVTFPVMTPAAPPVGRRGDLALAVAAAVDTVPGVRRSGGSGPEISTQYPGGKVIGIALADAVITVHVVAQRLPLTAVVEEVRTVAARVAGGDGGRRVDVVVDDLDVDSLPGRRS